MSVKSLPARLDHPNAVRPALHCRKTSGKATRVRVRGELAVDSAKRTGGTCCKIVQVRCPQNFPGPADTHGRPPSSGDRAGAGSRGHAAWCELRHVRVAGLAAECRQ